MGGQYFKTVTRYRSMSIMQGLEEGFMGFQNIRGTFCPFNWYQFANILTLGHGLKVNHIFW